MEFIGIYLDTSGLVSNAAAIFTFTTEVIQGGSQRNYSINQESTPYACTFSTRNLGD
jgi:hypothetical protein